LLALNCSERAGAGPAVAISLPLFSTILRKTSMNHESNMSANLPTIDVALRTSGAQRTPCVLLLDTSGSMEQYGRIGALNTALRSFQKAVCSDEQLRQQVLLMIISFGGTVRIELEWTQVDEFEAPTLHTNGTTPMGEAMTVALAAIEELRAKLKGEGIPYTKPWIFLLSDGGPNDTGWEAAAAESRRAAENSRVVVWPIAVPPEADGHALKQFAASDMNVYVVSETQFSSLFEWLTTSLGALSSSRPNDVVQIAAPSTVILRA
jgi:uncharacterized protein YegL